MPGRRGRDHERVDPRLDERLGRCRRLHAEICRNARCAGRIGVGDRQARNTLEREQGARVEEPDPSDSHHPELKADALLHRSKRLQ